MSASKSLVTYDISPSFIVESEGLREFQKEMQEFALRDPRRVAIVNAPTSSGKTYGFRLMSSKEKSTFIVLPNNLLSKEILNSFKQMGSKDVVLLNGQEINNKMNDKRVEGFSNFTKRSAIELLLADKDLVITNPEIMHLIIWNYYDSWKRKGDSLSRLVRNGLGMIVYDEIHVYNRDQISALISSILLFPNHIKFMFSSATIPKYLTFLMGEILGTDQIREITARRTFNSGDGVGILQGPIRATIFNGNTLDFVKSNVELMATGKWFLILDSIKNIHEVGSELIKFFPKDEILAISAYDDPSYAGYELIKTQVNQKRIVIGSNVIEQGINPPSDFRNFIIEPGNTSNSFIQRVGRIGRGAESESSLFIIIPAPISNHPQANEVSTIDQLYCFIESFRNNSDSSPKYKEIGIHLWSTLERLSVEARSAVIENLRAQKRFSQLLATINYTAQLNEDLSDEKWISANRSKLENLQDIANWWKNYRETFNQFISPQEKVVALDDSSAFVEEGSLRTEYSKLWLQKNKEITKKIKDDYWEVTEFRKKPDYSFEVEVFGLPFEPKKMSYGKIYFNARREIIDHFESFYKSHFDLPDNIVKDLKNLREIVRYTASSERLKLELDIV